jgi:hypothetical protein
MNVNGMHDASLEGAEMNDPPPPRPILAIVVTAVWGVLLVPGLLGAALSPMFFDAPGSMENPAAIFNALVVVSFPVLCIVSIVAVWALWLLHRRAQRRVPYAQIAAACLPMLPVAYVVVAIIVETAGVVLSGQPLGLHSTIIKH